MSKYNAFREELLSDPEVLKAYEEHKAEYAVAKALIQVRIASKMTQSDVAKKMKTSQSHVARLESGEHFPTIQSIFKYAQAVNKKIVLTIRP